MSPFLQAHREEPYLSGRMSLIQCTSGFYCPMVLECTKIEKDECFVASLLHGETQIAITMGALTVYTLEI